jgi:hypothetical protein
MTGDVEKLVSSLLFHFGFSLTRLNMFRILMIFEFRNYFYYKSWV